MGGSTSSMCDCRHLLPLFSFRVQRKAGERYLRRHLGSLPETAGDPPAGTERPEFQSSLIGVALLQICRDDESLILSRGVQGSAAFDFSFRPYM